MIFQPTDPNISANRSWYFSLQILIFQPTDPDFERVIDHHKSLIPVNYIDRFLNYENPQYFIISNETFVLIKKTHIWSIDICFLKYLWFRWEKFMFSCRNMVSWSSIFKPRSNCSGTDIFIPFLQQKDGIIPPPLIYKIFLKIGFKMTVLRL